MNLIKRIKTFVADKHTEEFDWDAVRAKYKADMFILQDINRQRKEVNKKIKRACNNGKFRVFVPILYPENEAYFKNKGFIIETTDNMSFIKWGE